MQQEIWGGWTCSCCGVEIDRNETKIGDPRPYKRLLKQFDEDGKSRIEKVFEDER
jgi:hypothetical protein